MNLCPDVCLLIILIIIKKIVRNTTKTFLDYYDKQLVSYNTHPKHKKYEVQDKCRNSETALSTSR